MSNLNEGTSAAAESPGSEPAVGQLLRTQRLENIGLLAARMAHDLNNMLAPMQMALPMLRAAIADPGACGLLDTIETTVVRAAGLVRQVLEYSHGEGGQFQLLMMQQLLREIARFASDTFPRNIRIEEPIAADLWRVSANLSQVHQVLLNLCVNARDAMPEGGTLRLRAENCQLDAAAAADIEGARTGAFVLIQVEDTGCGFPSTVLARLWQPFVTTKKVGMGCGLGLFTVHEIIVSHEGFIRLHTVPGQGSTFQIYLPAAGLSSPTAALLPAQVNPLFVNLST